jgi:hypothetical protein
MTIDPSAAFITRWKASGAGERANCQLFLSELCDLIGVARPNPTRNDDRLNLYVFERTVISTLRIMGRPSALGQRSQGQ